MLSQLLRRSDRFLQVFHENLEDLLEKCEETRDFSRKPAKNANYSKNGDNFEENHRKKQENCAVKEKTLLFLQEEFLVSALKQMIILGVLQKK